MEPCGRHYLRKSKEAQGPGRDVTHPGFLIRVPLLGEGIEGLDVWGKGVVPRMIMWGTHSVSR